MWLCWCSRLLMCFAVSGGVSNTVDAISGCPAGSHSVLGASKCSLCASGSFNPAVGQAACSCCAPGSFANASGLLLCLPCTGTDADACQQPCTIIPNCDCTDAANCDKNRCPSGCYVPNGTSVCQRAPAGCYTECGGSNCSASANVLDRCLPGTSSRFVGASSNSTCTACPAGSFCPTAGEGNPQLCNAGSYSSAVGATSSTVCTPCTAGTYSFAPGSTSCALCPAGSYCLAHSFSRKIRHAVSLLST